VEYFYPALFVLAMFGAALQSKALGVSICFALGLVGVYPSVEGATMLFILYLPAYLLASFRD